MFLIITIILIAKTRMMIIKYDEFNKIQYNYLHNFDNNLEKMDLLKDGKIIID